MSRNKAGLIWRVLLFIGVFAAIVLAALNRDLLDVALIDLWLSQLGLWAPLAYMVLFALGTILFAPGALFALAGGALFGPLWGTLFNLLGATIGATIAFLIARYLAGDWVQSKTGSRLQRLIEGVEAEGWRFVALIRLVPIFPFNLSNYAFGLTKIPLFTYALTSLITMIPGALAYTWLGFAGREAIEGNGSAIKYALLGLALFAAIAFLPPIIKSMRVAPKS
ncbi:DedA family protein, putative [hydrothermal vent metagenome]|uniref:DedA family protein, putative n=1 Tax=hydrothermal vent metagenome TaxID=652676 RepID=A0A3B0UHD1_9ZZZZ